MRCVNTSQGVLASESAVHISSRLFSLLNDLHLVARNFSPSMIRAPLESEICISDDSLQLAGFR